MRYESSLAGRTLPTWVRAANSTSTSEENGAGMAGTRYGWRWTSAVSVAATMAALQGAGDVRGPARFYPPARPGARRPRLRLRAEREPGTTREVPAWEERP